MSISKLYIFSKNTDASASMRGYLYQVLKAVETWIHNFNNNIDDEIYCDYEEDIFQKNQFSKTARFRQIKLYSRDFSFASEEIQKCIAHFFMLHVQTDYTSLEKEFVFEANTSIKQQQGENDAELLKNWNENQNNLSDELLLECSAKVKSIVTGYIQEQESLKKIALTEKKKKAEEKADNAVTKNSLKPTIAKEKRVTEANEKIEELKLEETILEEAIAVFSSLTESDWIEFTKRIKWQFKDTNADVEFTSLKENIEALILKLPFPIEKENLSTTFGLLHTTAWEKASLKNPDDKKLTLGELQEILLQAANEDDKGYWQIFDRWEGVTAINNFIIGEFYEILDATKHDSQWLSILKLYIDKTETLESFSRTAIYEYLWLRFRPIDFYAKPKGDLIGERKYFDFYFKDFNDFKNSAELEDAQSLMNIALAACFIGNTDLDIEQVRKWLQQMEATLIGKLETETNPNEICHLLENLGTHYLFLNVRERKTINVTEVITPLGKIFSYIDQADFYNATALSTRLNKYISMLIQINPEKNSALIDAIETFTEKLNPLIEKRHGSYNAAKVEVGKGVQYLNSDNPMLLLRALNCFHKAKTLWYRQEHMEGFVLALLNIAQLYSLMGMNLASKYYALGAAWISIHNGNRHLLKRIADAFGLAFDADLKQGAWMNAIISFADYMNARDEFKSTPLDLEIDEMPFKRMSGLSMILHATPKISPQLTVLIDAHIGMLGQIGEDFIKPELPNLEKNYPTDTSLKPILEAVLTDKPLNDVGRKRAVRFQALGSSWEISFNNDYETTAIAEEFCGILQIMLAEVALSKYDFHLVRSTLKIDLEVKIGYDKPEQQPSIYEFKWKVFIEHFDSQVPQEVNLHTAKTSTILWSILNEISLLPKNEFNDFFEKLFKENDLAGKTLVLGAYQRMYRYVFMKSRFDSLHRQFFEPVDAFFLNLPNTNHVMEWKNSLSLKYNQQQATENIKNRFRNSNRCIHLTIKKLKLDKDFPNFINELREKGWLDWQIIMSMMNFMLNHKTQLEISKQTFDNAEKYVIAFNEIFNQLLYTNEEECYVEFPLQVFTSVAFDFELNQTAINVLRAFELEYKSQFINFLAVKELLDKRFNMAKDMTNENNQLSDIK
jgi:hypothetical protein